nr:hypothetical protein [Nannocystis sp.]
MHDARGVGGLEAASGLDHHVDDVGGARPAAANPVGQALPAHQLHDDEHEGAGVGADAVGATVVMNDDDVLVGDVPGGARLVNGAFGRFGLTRDGGLV